jgi:hypothetical protein
MNKGMILYVTQGKNELDDASCLDMFGLRRELGVESVYLTTSEDEISYACWRMLAAGMHQVSCMHAQYHAEGCRLELGKLPFRLAG